uniref:EamA domain-containing protein n=1 Tax=Emiliania huxleyi TaxID=2903 RepID=A0A7S3WX95_EMIHU
MPKEEGHSAEAMFAMLAFSACSSSLLLINKLVIHYIPMPSFVSTAQFAVCTIFILGLRITGAAEVDGFEWEKVKPYLYYTIMFVCTIYCNMKALQYSNIETIIVFRSCVPLVVSQLDYLFLGRQLPSPASTGALLVLVVGAVGYVLSDAAFKLNGWNAYSWATAYFFIISVEMAYGKHIVGPHLKFKSLWGPTIYTNALAVLPMLAVGLLSSEASRADSAVWSGTRLLLLPPRPSRADSLSTAALLNRQHPAPPRRLVHHRRHSPPPWLVRTVPHRTPVTRPRHVPQAPPSPSSAGTAARSLPPLATRCSARRREALLSANLGSSRLLSAEVLGVANKMLTVLANLLLWDKRETSRDPPRCAERAPASPRPGIASARGIEDQPVGQRLQARLSRRHRLPARLPCRRDRL